MSRRVRLLLYGFLAVAGMVVAAGMALQHWLGSADFRARIEAAAGAAAGVPVHVERISLDWWPLPGAALHAVRLDTQPAWTIERLEARAVLSALWAGRLEVASLRVVGADLSQAGWDDLAVQRAKRPPTPDGGAPGVLPRSLLLESVTWRPSGAAASTFDAEILIPPDGLPSMLALKVTAGPLQAARLRLDREQLVWQVLVNHAGGKVKGSITMDRMPATGVELALQGRLVTEGVEMARLSQQRLGGQLSAETTLSWRSGRPGPLLDALQTQSSFTVRGAVVHGVDLARAVKTVGMNRGGETHLDTLGGQVMTRGRAVNFSNLVASSGILSASGQVAISPSQALGGRILVNLGPAAVGQAVGVPLVLGGTLDAPELTLTRSALLGAAVGTLVMPGVGTGAGASLGDKIGSKLQGLFGK